MLVVRWQSSLVAVVVLLGSWNSTILDMGTGCVWGDELVYADGTRVSGVVQSMDSQSVTIAPEAKGDAQSIPPLAVPLADLDTVEFSPAPSPLVRSRILIENLDGSRVTTSEGAIKLRSGTHQLNLTYWQNDGPTILKIDMEGPDHPRKPLSSDSLSRSMNYSKIDRSTGDDAEGYRLPDVSGESASNRVDYRLKQWSRGSDVQSIGDLRAIPTERFANKAGLNLKLKRSEQCFAVTFQCLFTAPVDGEYRFFVESSGQSTLSIGALPAIEQLNTPKPAKELWVIQTRGDGRIVGRLKSGGDGKIHLEMLLASQVGIELPIDENWLTDAWRVSVENGEQVVDRSGEPTESDSIYATGSNDQIQRVSGKLLGIEADKLRFEYNGKERAVPLDKVVGIVKAKTGMTTAEAVPVVPVGVRGLIAFPRQQQLPGVVSALGGDGSATIALPWGETITVKRSDMIRQVISGGRLLWLSDLTPDRVEETPYFDRLISWRRNESLTGTAINLGGHYYRKGVSQHSRSRLTYRLDGRYARFQSDVGLLSPEGATGNVTLRVLLDDVVAYEQTDFSAANNPNPLTVDLDVQGNQTLTLEVDFGKNYDVADHVGWGNAKLLRTK